MEIFAAIIKAVSSFVRPIFDHFGKRRERRILAAIQFRDSVLSVLAALYPMPTDWPDYSALDFKLKQVFPELQTAVASYRPYVTNKAAFDEAWLLYRSATKREVDVQCYLHYMTGTSTTNNAHGGLTVIKEDGPKNFKRNVDRLLEFAVDV
jgi:hypothetical protein